MRETFICSARSQGTTLIEMLVGTCLLGICLIAAGTMLAQSSSAMANSLYQQRAIHLASDIAEILRGVSATTLMQKENPVAHDCVSSMCSPTEFLQSRLTHWQQRAAAELPDGSVEYRVDRTGEMPAAQITVVWHGASAEKDQRQLEVALHQ